MEMPPADAMAIGKRLGAPERPKAKKRQAKAGPASGQRRKPSASDTTSELLGRTTDKVGKALGVLRITYKRAKAITEAAEQDPTTFGPLVREMDRRVKMIGSPSPACGQRVTSQRLSPSAPRSARSFPQHAQRGRHRGAYAFVLVLLGRL
jgi:hypothetical protein